MMRKGNVFLFMAAMLWLAGCSTLSVSSDYDTSVDFDSWRTYRWQEEPDGGGVPDRLSSNPLAWRRVKGAVDRELAAKGYRQRESGPVDFTVSVKGYVREVARILPAPASWQVGYYRGRAVWYRMWYGEPWPEVAWYDEGVLTVDFVDSKNKQLSWRGVVSGVVRDYDSPESMQRSIDAAVYKLLSAFPPGRK